MFSPWTGLAKALRERTDGHVRGAFEHAVRDAFVPARIKAQRDLAQ